MIKKENSKNDVNVGSIKVQKENSKNGVNVGSIKVQSRFFKDKFIRNVFTRSFQKLIELNATLTLSSISFKSNDSC